MYSVHRKNPQCVLANITQLLSDWFNDMRVSGRALCCLTSPDPHSQALKPLQTHHRVWPGVYSSYFWHSHAQRAAITNEWSSVASKSSWHLMQSNVSGMGETVSFIYNQVRSLWLNVVTARKSKSKLRHSREVTNLPVLCQVKLT